MGWALLSVPGAMGKMAEGVDDTGFGGIVLSENLLISGRMLKFLFRCDVAPLVQEWSRKSLGPHWEHGRAACRMRMMTM